MSFGRQAVRDRQGRERLVVDHVISHAKPKDRFASILMLREAYETQYGIHDYWDPKLEDELFASIAMRPQEDTISYSMEAMYISRYKTYRIREVYGYSLSEYFDLPYWKALWLLELEELRMEDESKIRDRAARDAERRAEQDSKNI